MQTVKLSNNLYSTFYTMFSKFLPIFDEVNEAYRTLKDQAKLAELHTPSGLQRPPGRKGEASWSQSQHFSGGTLINDEDRRWFDANISEFNGI